MRNLYQNSIAYIKLDKKGKPFKIGRGVKQGDPLSPNLFNEVIEEIIRGLNWENRGIKIYWKYLNNLRLRMT